MKPSKTQKKALYELLHKLVRLRDGEKCLKCLKTDRLQLSHIYPKGRYRLMEFVPENVKLLCVGCHLYWWHRNPIEAHEWLKIKLDQARLAKLKLMSQTYLGPFDPKLQILYLKQEIKKYDSKTKVTRDTQ